MATDGIQKDISVLRDNIAKLLSRQDGTKKQLDIMSRILVDTVAKSMPNATFEELCDTILSSLNDEDDIHVKVFTVGRLAEISDRPSSLSDRDLFGDGDDALAGTHGKIAYVKNTFNDKAFGHFSKSIKNPKSVFVQSFTDACEEVFNNYAEYCILPISNTEDGRLFRFYSMLERYDLKIVKSFVTEKDDLSGNICFCLAGRHADLSLSKSKGLVFEFSLVRSSGDLLTKVGEIISLFGADILSVDTASVRYDDNASRYYFSVSAPISKLRAIALYLTLEYPDYTPIGIFGID